MHSIGLIVAWLFGCALGLVVLDRYPQGLEQGYGLALLGLALFLAVPALLVRRLDRGALWGCLFLIATLAGCGRALLVHAPVTARDLAYYNTREGDKSTWVTVRGTVAGEPVLADRWQRVRVAAGELAQATSALQSVSVSGDLLVMVPRYPVYSAGDLLSLTGTLSNPPEVKGMDYPAYLARLGVYSYMSYPRVKSLGSGTTTPLSRLIADARRTARASLRASIPEPQAALAVGVVVGDRTSMPPDLQEAFARSGTVHVLAISGENIALLVGFVWLLFSVTSGQSRMPTWLVMTMLGALAIYTAFTGATASVVRAAIMGGVLLLAPVVRRRYDPMAALAAAALLMTLLNPNILGDGGFMLSFGAMLGIALVSPRLMKVFGRARVPRLVGAALAAGLGAQAVTLPLAAMLTGRISFVSPLATLSIDWALLPLMVSGMFTAIGYPVLPALGHLFGVITWAFGEWMVFCVRLWAGVPWAAVEVPRFEPAWLLPYYTGLALLLHTPKRRRAARDPLPADRLAVAAGATLAAAWALAAWFLLFR